MVVVLALLLRSTMHPKQQKKKRKSTPSRIVRQRQQIKMEEITKKMKRRSRRRKRKRKRKRKRNASMARRKMIKRTSMTRNQCTAMRIIKAPRLLLPRSSPFQKKRHRSRTRRKRGVVIRATLK